MLPKKMLRALWDPLRPKSAPPAPGYEDEDGPTRPPVQMPGGQVLSPIVHTQHAAMSPIVPPPLRPYSVAETKHIIETLSMRYEIDKQTCDHIHWMLSEGIVREEDLPRLLHGMGISMRPAVLSPQSSTVVQELPSVQEVAEPLPGNDQALMGVQKVIVTSTTADDNTNAVSVPESWQTSAMPISAPQPKLPIHGPLAILPIPALPDMPKAMPTGPVLFSLASPPPRRTTSPEPRGAPGSQCPSHTRNTILDVKDRCFVLAKYARTPMITDLAN